MKLRKLVHKIVECHNKTLEFLIPRKFYSFMEYHKARMIAYTGLSIYLYLLATMVLRIFLPNAEFIKVNFIINNLWNFQY